LPRVETPEPQDPVGEDAEPTLKDDPQQDSGAQIWVGNM
jgi:hypothetical protein